MQVWRGVLHPLTSAPSRATAAYNTTQPTAGCAAYFMQLTGEMRSPEREGRGIRLLRGAYR
jgi:hypothetical protein